MGSILEKMFDDWRDLDNKPKHKNYNKPVSILEFPCIHRDDSEPVTIIMPHVKAGPWIAGGACLRWYQGQPVVDNDIDIFCSGPGQAQLVIDEIKSYGRYSVKHESNNAVTLSYHNPDCSKYWTLQVIKRRYFNSLQEVIDNFDISVCQVGTGGNEWMLGTNTAKDIRDRTLRMALPLAPDAAKRLAKYWTYGYRPVEGLLDNIRNNPNAAQEFAIDGDYENAF